MVNAPLKRATKFKLNARDSLLPGGPPSVHQGSGNIGGATQPRQYGETRWKRTSSALHTVKPYCCTCCLGQKIVEIHKDQNPRPDGSLAVMRFTHPMRVRWLRQRLASRSLRFQGLFLRLSDFAIFRLSSSQTFRPSDFSIFRPCDFPILRFSYFPMLQLSDLPIFRLSDFQILRFL